VWRSSPGAVVRESHAPSPNQGGTHPTSTQLLTRARVSHGRFFRVGARGSPTHLHRTRGVPPRTGRPLSWRSTTRARGATGGWCWTEQNTYERAFPELGGTGCLEGTTVPDTAQSHISQLCSH
jgi:hypothetical protein